jgi:TonB family protein
MRSVKIFVGIVMLGLAGHSIQAQCAVAAGSGTGCLNGKLVQGVPVDAVATAAALLSKRIVSDPLPAYPKVTLDSHEGGLVSALILVGKDGHVERVMATDGPPSLLQVSTDAIQRWTYQPVLVDDQAVRAMSTVFLSFMPGAEGVEPTVRHVPFLPRTGVAQNSLLTKVEPVYPAAAKKKHISGTVVMHALIGEDGKVQNLDAISGPAELRGAAIDAVRKWTYKPMVFNGNPTPWETTITINFNLVQ